MATTTDEKTNVTLRVPAALIAQVRQIAERESETASTIIRRYIRRGLEGERREAVGGSR